MSLPPLRLHIQYGPDWGLSIVGTRHELINLARKLEAAATAPPTPPLGKYQQLIYAPEVESPYRDRPYFGLAFCVDGSEPSRTALPKVRSGPSALALICTIVLSLIGLVTSLRWIWYAML